MDKALLARVENQAWFHKYPRGLPTLLFVLVVMVTAVAVIAIERSDANARRLLLERNAAELASSLERRAAENIAYVNAAAKFFSWREGLSRRTFSNFAAEINAGDEARGTLGMGYAPLLVKDALPQLEDRIRQDENAGFRVFPRPKPGEGALVPILYLEPESEPNRNAVGYDMYSEPTRKLALNTAVRTGRPTVTGRVHLIQDLGNGEAFGFLIYAPVIEGQSGRERITGFVYSPIRANDFLASAIDLMANSRIDAAIYDGSKSSETMLAERRLPGRTSSVVDTKVEVGGREWILSVADKRPAALTLVSKVTLLFGLIVAAMLTFFARVITKRSADDRLVLEWLSRQTAIRNSLTRELNHRVKNTLANVLSIISLTRHRSQDIDEFAEGLIGRIRALSATHDLLSQSDWNDALVAEIVESEVAPYMQGSENLFSIEGPDIRLAPNDALSLGLAIHELATNAAKYGALSVESGKVAVSWCRKGADLLEFKWQEAGGPPVSPPQKRGFGIELLERVVAQELNTDVSLDFAPDGLCCTLRIPVRQRTDFTLRSRV